MHPNQHFSHSFKLVSLLLTASVLLLQGCASQKEVAPQFTADPAAFDYAVSEAVIMQLNTSECGKLGGDMSTKANDAASAWYQRNWPQVQVADQNYTQKLASKTIVYNNEKIALPAIKLYSTAEKNIRIQLDQTRHSRSSIMDFCNRKLTGYKDGTLDLSRNQNADLYLKSLATSPATTPYKIPLLAGSLVTNSNPGRSQFNLEKTMGESGCVNGEILTLRNDWPYEVYGAFCAGDKTVFISCEWGECKAQ